MASLEGIIDQVHENTPLAHALAIVSIVAVAIAGPMGMALAALMVVIYIAQVATGTFPTGVAA